MHEGQKSTQMTVREEVVSLDQSNGRPGHKHRQQGECIKSIGGRYIVSA